MIMSCPILNKISENKLRRIGFFIFAMLSLAIMILIFCFSAQTAVKSDQVESAVVNNQTQVIETVLKDNKSQYIENVVRWFEIWIRKIAHILTFAALGFFLCGTFISIDKIKKIYVRILLALGVGLVYGITDEVHQIFVEGRSPEIGDVVYDFSGVLLGAILMLLCYSIVIALSKSRHKSI